LRDIAETSQPRAALEKVSALAGSASVQDRSVYVATKFNVLMPSERRGARLMENAKPTSARISRCGSTPYQPRPPSLAVESIAPPRP
jgi:hypothetical protein